LTGEAKSIMRQLDAIQQTTSHLCQSFDLSVRPKQRTRDLRASVDETDAGWKDHAQQRRPR